MKVKDVIDRLQPGMLYQRVHMAGYDKKSDPVTVTGKVVGHNTDVNDNLWIGVIEFYLDRFGSVVYLANRVEKIYGIEDEFALLEYSEASIREMLEIGTEKSAKAADSARNTADRAELEAAMISTITEDFVRAQLLAAHRVQQVGQGTLTAREDYDQRVVAAVNEIEEAEMLRQEAIFQERATEES